MKKILIIIAIAASINCSGRTTEKSKIEIPKDTNYVLVGKLGGFQLLYKALTAPGDVTPNQINSLIAWLQNVQAVPVNKESEKPKN